MQMLCTGLGVFYGALVLYFFSELVLEDLDGTTPPEYRLKFWEWPLAFTAALFWPLCFLLSAVLWVISRIELRRIIR